MAETVSEQEVQEQALEPLFFRIWPDWREHFYDPRPFCRSYETPEGEVWVEVREAFVRA